MRRAIVLSCALVALAATGASADELRDTCRDQARAYFAKFPGPARKPKDVSPLVFINPDEVLYRCQIDEPFRPELAIAAHRIHDRWVTAPVAALFCPKYTVKGRTVMVKHSKTCPVRWWHPAICVRYTSRIRMTARGATIKRLSTWRKPICRICPDSTANNCLPKARRAARALYDRGKVEAAARLMRSALDHVAHWALSHGGPSIDPWAVNDALYYAARVGLPCDELAHTWARIATRTARSRRAFEYNAARCHRR